MNKYLTVFTILLIAVANAAVFTFNQTCMGIYGSLETSLPLFTRYALLLVQNNIYLLFSMLTVAVILLTAISRYENKNNHLEQIILGLHLLILSALFFAFMLPFISMCATIE